MSGRIAVGRASQFVVLAMILGLFSQGNARIAYAKASSAVDPTPEERSLLAAAEQDPANAQLASSLGAYYLHHERWRDSLPWLRKAYTLSAGNESIGYDLAFACLQAGELEGAKQQIDLMLGKADSARLHNLLGTVEERRTNYLEAAKEFHRAAEIDPSEQNIFDLATFLLQHKKYVGFVDESLKFFRYGVAQFPRSSQMMVGLGVALYVSEQYDEAVRVLCAAVDLDPTDRRPIEFLGRASKVSPELAAEVDQRLKDFAQRYPANAATNYYYAFSLWQRGGGQEGKNLDEIEGLLRKAVALAPEWYEPHFQLGVVYDDEKRYPDAIREMQKAADIDPDSFPAHFRLAMLYDRTGDKSRATQEAALVRRIKDKDRKDDMGQGVEK